MASAKKKPVSRQQKSDVTKPSHRFNKLAHIIGAIVIFYLNLYPLGGAPTLDPVGKSNIINFNVTFSKVENNTINYWR